MMFELALVPMLSPQFGEDGAGLVVIGTIVALFFIGLPAVISLLRNAKPQPVVETHTVREPSREVDLSDSWLAGQAA